MFRMLDFLRQLAAGVAVMAPTLTGLALAARLSEDPPGTRPASSMASNGMIESRADARLRELRERGMMLEQLNHHQMLYNMRNDAMWRSFYQQQDMIRSQRY